MTITHVQKQAFNFLTLQDDGDILYSKSLTGCEYKAIDGATYNELVNDDLQHNNIDQNTKISNKTTQEETIK